VSAEVPTDVPPAAFGRYRVLHQIERGSLGPVFRGEDPNTRAAVVIKQFQLNLSPDSARKVAEELKGLKGSPTHRLVPAVMDAGVHRADPYLVTALVPGESLDVALREYGPAAIADALPRLRLLADALDRAAAVGVWHGALEPHDILIDQDDTYLIGLGVTPTLERAGIRRSTRRPYAAPELMNGDPTSVATDQYALGAIAYEWFFGGRAPRSAESVLDAPSLPGVDAEALSAALMSALASNPAERFTSCTAFVDAIDDALDVSTVSGEEDEELVAGAGLLPLEGFVAEDAPDHPDDDHDLKSRRKPTPPVDIPLKDAARTSPPPRSMMIDAPISTPRVTEPVAWQGSLGMGGSPVVPRRITYSAGMLVTALVIGAALGGAAGYMFAMSRQRPAETSVAAANGESTATPTQPAKEFTDAPVSTPSPTPASPPDAKLAARGSEPARTPPSAPSTAENAPTPRETAMLIRSTPSGAVVVVDGTSRGTTPLTLRDVALGTRTVVVSRPGYVSSERQVTLTADRPSRSLDVRLSPISPPATTAASRTSRDSRPATSAATGSLVVDSRPVGSSVTINGQPAGTTPLTMESVPPGTVTVRIERSGYRPWTQTIELKAGERRRVAASLEIEQE